MALRAQTRMVVRGYFAAWTARDMGAARARLADDLDYEGAIDRFSTADAYLESLSAFAWMVTETRLIAETYDGLFASLLYDCVTDTPAGTIRISEHLRAVDGIIDWIRAVFDPSELQRIAAEAD